MIAAVVVLYNPDIALFHRLLQSVVSQVEHAIVVDNTPGSSRGLSPIPASYLERVTYVPLGDNMGIATAQNAGIRLAMDGAYTHILLLDQDSIPAGDMVSQLVRAERDLLDSGCRVAAVAPLFFDSKTNKPSHAIQHKALWVKRVRIDPAVDAVVKSDYVISSGSLIRVSAFRTIGMMLDALFIDWVDIEWGLRAAAHGYSCFIIPAAIMEHSLGDEVVRIPGRDVHMHSDIRNYYIVRNATYLLRVKSMGPRWRVLCALKIPQYVFFYSAHAPDKLRSVALLMRAVLDGAGGRLGRFN